jgi:hypothetical protein
MTDGAGAQLQRILCIFLVAKKYNVGYLHTGIKKLSYNGLKSLEENRDDSKQVEVYNKLFHLPSTPCGIINRSFKTFDIAEEHIKEYKIKEGNTLFYILHAGTLINSDPSILQESIPNSLSYRSTILGRKLRIAVHIRRGELFVVDSDRMLPNSYYIGCIKKLSEILLIPHEFHIHTEVVTKPVLVTPSHHGIINRINESVLISPSDNHLEEFEGIPNIIWRINECPIQTLKDMISSDIFIASRSSYSYVAAIIKKKGVLFHPFWHALSPEWIPVTHESDIEKNKDKIMNSLVNLDTYR